MSTENQTTPWVCPWGICPHEDAQKCRFVTSGCGGRFPSDMSPQRAAWEIRRPFTSTPTKEPS